MWVRFWRVLARASVSSETWFNFTPLWHNRACSEDRVWGDGSLASRFQSSGWTSLWIKSFWFVFFPATFSLILIWWVEFINMLKIWFEIHGLKPTVAAPTAFISQLFERLKSKHQWSASVEIIERHRKRLMCVQIKLLGTDYSRSLSLTDGFLIVLAFSWVWPLPSYLIRLSPPFINSKSIIINHQGVISAFDDTLFL